MGFRDLGDINPRRASRFLVDYLVAQLNALVADIYSGPCDELLHLLLGFAAERALELAFVVGVLEHVTTSRLGLAGLALEDVVDDAVVLGLLGGHVVVALGILLDTINRLPRMARKNLVGDLLDSHDLSRLDLDVSGLTGRTAGRLVDHDARIRKGIAFAFRAGGQEHRCHAGRKTYTHRGNLRLHVLHRIVYRKPARHRPARAVDVKVDVLVRVLTLEKQHLRNDQIRHAIVDWAPDEDDPVFEKPGVYIVGPLAATGLFHNYGYQGHRHHLPQATLVPYRVHRSLCRNPRYSCASPSESCARGSSASHSSHRALSGLASHERPRSARTFASTSISVAARRASGSDISLRS